MDQISLSDAVEYRFGEVFELYGRVHGDPRNLKVPDDIQKAIYRWREMVYRHKKGDYRHNDDEYKCLKKVAEWTLKIKCDLTDTPYDQKRVLWS